MIWRILLGAIVIVFVLRFILNFLLPLFKVSLHTSRKLKEMQQKMQQMEKVQQHETARPKEGEYIDYEEMK